MAKKMFFEEEDGEDNDQIPVNKKVRNINLTATDRGTDVSMDDQSNSSVYLKKHSLKDRLVQGGRW